MNDIKTIIEINNTQILVKREGTDPLRFVWSDHMKTWAPCILPEQRQG